VGYHDEELERLEQTWRSGETLDLVCECAAPDCDARISLSVEDYQGVREHSARFIILCGHEIPEVERICESNDGILVVEKLGVGGEFAGRHNPRADA
jgi:hypothetical protein